jgi:hypothetical protein
MKKISLTTLLFFAAPVLAATYACAQQQIARVVTTSPDSSTRPDDTTSAQPASTPNPTLQTATEQHQLGRLNLTVNWRFRTEAWDWFEPSVPAQNSYAFEHSLLRIGLGQKKERFEWFFEGAQDAIVNLPTAAVLPGASGQLGLGGTYYAANGNGQNNANAFVRQAYVAFALPANAKLRVGRFTFLDGAEVIPKDKSLATIVNSRVTQRLVGDFGFSAVGRSYDGAQLAFNTHAGNFTFLGARPTRGVYQIDAMGELDIDLFYGAYTIPVKGSKFSGQFRLFSLGYIDERSSVLKTDNRSAALRSADRDHIRIGTYGADYAHVFHTQNHGQFDFLFWGAVQNGSWGTLTQHAGAFVGEAGWQPGIPVLNPWFRAGYSYGSGDPDPSDGRHGTFFQVLPTPRPYARFPFYNMMNNEDFFASSTFRLPRSFVVRSELHALRLAGASDLWYGGGGAFQPHTFGYTGRASNGNRSLANVWDVSMDVPLRYGFSLTTYYAHAWGKALAQNIYPAGSNAQFGYVETNFHF